MKKLLLLTFLFLLGKSSYSQCTDLFFSKYLEGNSNNKALEIYNPTSNPINLSGYKLIKYITRDPALTLSSDTMVLYGTVPAMGTITFKHPSCALAITGTDTGFISHNGNDCYALVKIATSTTIDAIGPYSDNTARAVNEITFGTNGSLKDKTLRRYLNVGAGITTWNTGQLSWEVLPTDNIAFWASHYSPCSADTFLSFYTYSGSVSEATGAYNLAIISNKTLPTTFTAPVSLLSGAASNISNPASFPANATFPVTSSTTNLPLTIVNNTIVDGNRTLTFSLGVKPSSTNVKLIYDSTHRLTIIDDDGSPTVVVAASTFTKKEGTSGWIYVKLNRPATVASSVDYTITGLNSGANPTVDLKNFSTPKTISFAVGDTSYKFTFDAALDNVAEPTDSFLFKLSNPVNLTLASYDSVRFFIIDSTVASMNGRPLYTIAKVKGNNTNGKPDSIGVSCNLRGVAYGVNRRSPGLEFSLCDGTGCIGVYSKRDYPSYPNVLEGDSLEVSGGIVDYFGLSQIACSGTTDTIFKLGFKPINAPMVVTALNETTESKLVKLENLTLVNGTWTANSFFNLTMKNATTNFVIRINNNNNYFSSTPLIVSGTTYSITGLGGQYDTTTAKNSGYQLLPRYKTDITSGSGPITNISSVEDGLKMDIYPNPIEDNTIQVLIWSPSSTKATARIFQIDGKLVFTNEVKLNKGTNKIYLKDMNMTTGQYFLNINSESQNLTLPFTAN